jgi:hypothetical protein
VAKNVGFNSNRAFAKLDMEASLEINNEDICCSKSHIGDNGDEESGRQYVITHEDEEGSYGVNVDNVNNDARMETLHE